jgi:hypothetical protein
MGTVKMSSTCTSRKVPVLQHQKTEVRKVPKSTATKDKSVTLNNVQKVHRRSTYTIGYYEIYLKSPELKTGEVIL